MQDLLKFDLKAVQKRIGLVNEHFFLIQIFFSDLTLELFQNTTLIIWQKSIGKSAQSSILYSIHIGAYNSICKYGRSKEGHSEPFEDELLAHGPQTLGTLLVAGMRQERMLATIAVETAVAGLDQTWLACAVDACLGSLGRTAHHVPDKRIGQ